MGWYQGVRVVGGCMFLNKRGYQQEGMKKERRADTPFHYVLVFLLSSFFGR